MRETAVTLKATAVHPDIPGLQCVPRFLTKAEQQNLLACIERAPWNTAMSRRVQHYGFRYDYRARNVTGDDCLGPYPGWLQVLAENLAPAGSHPCFDRQAAGTNHHQRIHPIPGNRQTCRCANLRTHHRHMLPAQAKECPMNETAGAP